MGGEEGDAKPVMTVGNVGVYVVRVSSRTFTAEGRAVDMDVVGVTLFFIEALAFPSRRVDGLIEPLSLLTGGSRRELAAQ